VESAVKAADGTAGKFVLTAGKWFNDAEKDKGIQTSQDARFYQISAKFAAPFSNKDKPLVVQYTVKHEQKLDCGGAYFKLLPPGLDQNKFEGDSAYNIMFGPDVCGSVKKVHAILNYKGQNHLVKKNPYPETDQLTHLYTWIINPDQSYEIFIDGESKQKGTVEEDWDVLPAKRIKDPAVSKPVDWVDESMIPDPSAVKPDGWDDIPKEIPDSDAKKPEDWDPELDGDWEPPTVPNPAYKGEWKAPMIDNPAYKGEWEHPVIDNPEYKPDASISTYTSEFLGIEIWQVKSGTIFDNFLVTDDPAEAKAFADGYFKQLQEGEKKAFDAEEEKRKQKETEEREKKEKEEPAEEDGDDDDDDDDAPSKDAHHDHGHDEL